MTIVYNSRSTAETEEFAALLVKNRIVSKGDFVALHGDLGAGKTALVRGLVRGIAARYGAPDLSSEVTSPTFALINIYNAAVKVWHCDFYRISGEDDLYSTGFYDCDTKNVIIAAEWANLLSFAVPDDAVLVFVEKTGENSRKITVRTKTAL